MKWNPFRTAQLHSEGKSMKTVRVPKSDTRNSGSGKWRPYGEQSHPWLGFIAFEYCLFYAVCLKFGWITRHFFCWGGKNVVKGSGIMRFRQGQNQHALSSADFMTKFLSPSSKPWEAVRSHRTNEWANVVRDELSTTYTQYSKVSSFHSISGIHNFEFIG